MLHILKQIGYILFYLFNYIFEAIYVHNTVHTEGSKPTAKKT